MSVRGAQRRRKESDSDDNQPMFLKKCYNMITNCPPDIASWSEDGQSFIVYDVNRLSSEIIPSVYKHNKFPSFVRQLNFCKYLDLPLLDLFFPLLFYIFYSYIHYS